MEEKRKYLEYFDGAFDSTVADKIQPENKPYVAYSKTEGVVYTVIPKPVVYEPYVTFTAQEDNSSIGLTKLSTNQTMEYSMDTSTWNAFDKTTNISINNGDKVYVRGILSADISSSNFTQFKMSGKIAAYGNCNALWNYEDLEAPLKVLCGYKMFFACTSLTTAPELPATTLANGCYTLMFSGCTSLVTAPELPATILVKMCYLAMFSNCRNLSYIKCLAVDTSASNCTYLWVNQVPSTGRFVKNAEKTDWKMNANGIPSGWTVEDAVL